MTEHKKFLGGLNSILWGYYRCATRLEREAIEAADDQTELDNTVLVVLLSVSIFEAFLNIYFRSFIDEVKLADDRRKILEDLRKRKSLRHKIKKWPRRAFGRGFNLEAGIGQNFIELMDRRNQLMHFTTECNAIELNNIRIINLVDLTAYKSLRSEDASEALRILEGIMTEFFRLQGRSDEQCRKDLHFWLGRVA